MSRPNFFACTVECFDFKELLIVKCLPNKEKAITEDKFYTVEVFRGTRSESAMYWILTLQIVN